MSGHSHWAGIKHKKEAADQKRGKIFSKLLTAITAAAKTEANPDFNPRLRTAVEKAREAKVPAENIERAVKRASESSTALDELLFEAYGPGGIAFLIEAITDNRNRTIAEVKKILSEHGGKLAESGSVAWAFERKGQDWQAKFPQKIDEPARAGVLELVSALGDHDDVQKVYTNLE